MYTQRLSGKTAVITGAAGGMGSVISGMLADAGVKLALTSYNSDRLSALAERLSEKTKVLARQADIRNEREVSKFISDAANTFGSPDILVNLAGISIPAKLDDMTTEDYNATMDINIKGTFLASKYFVKAADEKKGAQIINIGSMAAKRANANAPLYCAVKAALNMLSAGMALQFKEKNIRVTTLNPAGADTPFWGDRPVNRDNLLKASDIAEVVMFVLTRENRVMFSDISFESFLNM